MQVSAENGIAVGGRLMRPPFSPNGRETEVWNMYDMMNAITGTRRMTGYARDICPARHADGNGSVFGMEPIALSAAPAALQRPAKCRRKALNNFAEYNWSCNARHGI